MLRDGSVREYRVRWVTERKKSALLSSKEEKIELWEKGSMSGKDENFLLNLFHCQCNDKASLS